jgi:RimJ/RimL family protein N-acetyltransferase
VETVVQTDRLVLRPFVPADIDELVVLHDYLAGVEKRSGRFVGWYGLHVARGSGRDDAPGDYWLGYRLHKWCWGNGYATEGVRALIANGFTKLGVLRVRATTMAVNTRSRQVMERCGLRYVRTFHEQWDDPLPGTEHGEVEYALTKPDWDHRAT